MGWNSWNAFRLKIDDATIRAQAAALVKSGMKKAGYEYVVIDGGWEGFHDEQGVFHSDAQRFPDMKALCDYIHSLGLKAGIHTSPGPKTCSGREASYGHETQDAETFARWGMDFVKYDWCSGDQVYKPGEMQAAYKKMADALAATGRPMLYSLCQYGMQNVWKWGGSVGGQMWRTTGDIADKYNSMILIGFGQNGLEKYAGPGHWNDPDMLEIGNGGMTEEEYRTHMTLWCILAAPLFAGNDLTKMSQTTLELLTNSDAIAIDQDPAGILGTSRLAARSARDLAEVFGRREHCPGDVQYRQSRHDHHCKLQGTWLAGNTGDPGSLVEKRFGNDQQERHVCDTETWVVLREA
jgi:alpha-galactosidase